MTRRLGLGEALARFHATHGLSPHQAEARTWTCGVGPFRLRFPNFAWRRDAIVRHDLHHVLTGYACTLPGEFQMAAWEFGAGRCPRIGATLFCLPLITAGLAVAPRRTYRAFLRGRAGRSLYGAPVTDNLLRSPLAVVAQSFAPQAGRAKAADVVAFLRLASASIMLVLSPLLLAVAAVAAAG